MVKIMTKEFKLFTAQMTPLLEFFNHNSQTDFDAVLVLGHLVLVLILWSAVEFR